MRYHIFQHVPFEGPGYLRARINGIKQASVTAFFDDGKIPDLDSFDCLIVMGGPMGVYDESKFPWITRERRFLEKAIAAGKRILGVCLGAQMLAAALGSKVYPGKQKEIGWFPVEWKEHVWTKDLGSQTTVFHWHGDTFDLPHGCERLASSVVCENQAFLYDGRVLGLQFHLEATPQTVGLLLKNCGEELVHAPFIQTAEKIREGSFDEIHRCCDSFLSRLFPDEPSAIHNASK